MAYTEENFKTKKALREAVKDGEVRLQPEAIGGLKQNGTAYVEGPHYPAPHTWYATVELRDGVVVKVKS
jgi:hypothetical protein